MWTKATLEYLINNSNTMSDEAMAAELTKMLGIPFKKDQVTKRRQRLGLKKIGGRGNVKLR